MLENYFGIPPLADETPNRLGRGILGFEELEIVSDIATTTTWV